MRADPQFYVTGGTLRANAGCYLERQADREVYDTLLRGEFCYVLTARQMGKSSLMVRSTLRLRQAGANVVAVDLTGLGSNLTPEQWYEGMALQIGQRIQLETEMEDFWATKKQVAPCQRLFMGISEVVQPLLRQRVAEALPEEDQLSDVRSELSLWRSLIVFIDEIDMVRSLPFSTDEFFGAIRECYNSRAWGAQLGQVSFCLLGVATPSQLIQDPKVSPFNIGHRIELADFSRQQLDDLGVGFGGGPRAERILDRVHAWTGGHPYLTQKLCRSTAESDPTQTRRAPYHLVDRLCRDLFLNPKASAQDDNLLFVRDRVLNSEVERSAILGLYEDTLRGRYVSADTRDPVVNCLLLSGLVRPEQGRLRVRNRIYARKFNLRWVRRELPSLSVRAQRKAYWRGMTRAALFSTVAVSLLLVFSLQQSRLAKSEAERSARLQQLDAFFELSEDLFALASTDGRFLKLNRKWEEVLGYSRDYLCSVPYNSFVHPEDRDGTATRTRHLAEGLSVLNFTNRYRCHHGSYVTLVWRATTDPDTGLICATARVIETASGDE
jgi:PAS domain S-box-containing protein